MLNKKKAYREYTQGKGQSKLIKTKSPIEKGDISNQGVESQWPKTGET